MKLIVDDTGSLEKPLESCQDFGEMCFTDDLVGKRARQYCPESCGCKTPVSKLNLATPEHGCPSSCTESPEYLEKLDKLRCHDWTPDDPQMLDGEDVLTVYVESFIYTGWPSMDEFATLINSTLHAKGCAGTV